MSIDHLIDNIRKKRNPTAAGLDPRLEFLPSGLLQKHIDEQGETLEAAAAATWEYNCGLIDALADVVPCVKLQSACYEMLGVPGMQVLRDSILYAREAGLYVIADAKRGDIGSTSEAYSAAFLGKTKVGNTLCEAFPSDAVTVNPYLGSDNTNPFLADCKMYGKSIFMLVKTSNKSSMEVQELLVGGGQPVYRSIGEQVERAGREFIGQYGYSEIGMVLGGTYPGYLREFRKLMPHVYFLVPGYGAQGADAKDVSYAFDELGRGAVINSSRAILCAWQKQEGVNWADAARNEAVRMRDELKQFTTFA